MAEPTHETEDLPPLAGRLLVATPSLVDPNFRESVVLVLDHGPEGTFGLILNRPTPMPVAEPLPAWADHATEPAVVFVGGPVEPDGAIGLARLRPGLDVGDWGLRVGEFPVVDLAAGPGVVGDALAGLRAFAGHSGWIGGQLEAEIAVGSWFVVEREPEDVFTAEPEGMWRRVLARQGGVFSTVTPDPSAN